MITWLLSRYRLRRFLKAFTRETGIKLTAWQHQLLADIIANRRHDR